jgi:hypothetical protein
MCVHVIDVELRVQSTIEAILTLEAVLLARCQLLLNVNTTPLFELPVVFPDPQTFFFLLDPSANADSLHVLALD